MSTIISIKKRNGQVVDFRPEKIAAAMKKSSMYNGSISKSTIPFTRYIAGAAMKSGWSRSRFPRMSER